MVLIVSESSDLSTNTVIDWLKYLGKSFLRINDSDKVTIDTINFSSYYLYFRMIHHGIKTTVIESTDIESIWYRRGEIGLSDISFETLQKNRVLHEGLLNYLRDEMLFLNTSLYQLISQVSKRKIDSVDTAINKKIDNLLLAKNIGFEIPPTIITNNKEELLKFSAIHNYEIITKGISENIGFEFQEGRMIFLTSVLKKETVENLPSTFFPSLFQKRISKKLDIRITYIKGNIFSAAIYTPSKYRSIVDVRNVDKTEDRSTRIIPFQLNEKNTTYLHSFMKKLNRDSGSLDFILSQENILYFLEINPVGQFGFISDACNYYIEKHIATAI